MFITGSIPIEKCYIRKEFLYDEQKGHGEFEECIIFGVNVHKNKAVTFNIHLPNGAVYWERPIHAFCHIKTNPAPKIDIAEFWDAFSYDFTIVEFDYLKWMDTQLFLGDGVILTGKYLFTIDFADLNTKSGHINIPSERKCLHMSKGTDGNYYLYPNNRMKFIDSSFVTRPDEIPDYKVNTHQYFSEGRFTIEDNDNYFYKEKERKE